MALERWSIMFIVTSGSRVWLRFNLTVVTVMFALKQFCSYLVVSVLEV